MVVSLNYCSQNGGNLYRDPYYNGNPNIGPRIIGNLDQYPYGGCPELGVPFWGSPYQGFKYFGVYIESPYFGKLPYRGYIPLYNIY